MRRQEVVLENPARVLIALLALIMVLAAVMATRAHGFTYNPNQHVYDDAGVFTSAQRTELQKSLTAYFAKTSIPIVMVTITGEGMSQHPSDYEVEKWAVNVANSWKLGGDLKNGVMILNIKNQRKIHIQPADKLYDFIYKSDIHRLMELTILPTAKPEEKGGKSDLPGALIAGINGMMQILGDVSWNQRLADKEAADKESREKADEAMRVFSYTLLALIALAVIGGLVVRAFSRAAMRTKVVAMVATTRKSLLDALQYVEEQEKNAFRLKALLETRDGWQRYDRASEYLKSAERRNANDPDGAYSDVMAADQAIDIMNGKIKAYLDLKSENEKRLAAMVGKVGELETLIPSAEAKLVELKEKYPPAESWQRFDEKLAGLASLLQDARNCLAEAGRMNSMEEQRFEDATKKINALKTTIKEIEEIIEEPARAMQKIASSSEEIPRLIEEIRRMKGRKRISAGKLEELERKLSQAESLASSSQGIDILDAMLLLLVVHAVFSGSSSAGAGTGTYTSGSHSQSSGGMDIGGFSMGGGVTGGY